MKALITILCSFLFITTISAQSPNFNNLWQQVQLLEVEGKPKSALAIVEEIAIKAKQESNEPQYLKTLLFKSKFAMILEEDSALTAITNLKTEISRASSPTKNVLQNMLAKLYWDYFQNYRYKFYDRTKTESKVDSVDFRTWDLETLFQEISFQYQESLKNGLLLQSTPVHKYEVILESFEGSADYRPSLFDLLSHNALNFFTTPENNITQPSYKFELTDASFLQPAEEFSLKRIASRDSTSTKLLALHTYQNLLRFHILNNNELAKAAVDIERLTFIKDHGRFPEMETKYLNALTYQKENTANTYAKGMYELEVARTFISMGSTYVPLSNETHRWKKKEALAICNALIETFPESVLASQASSLKQGILEPYLAVTAEEYLPSNTASRLLIDYKNQDTLFVTVYAISRNKQQSLNRLYNNEERLKFIEKLKVEKRWSSSLTNEGDYQRHKTEVLFPELPNGHYVYVVKTNEQDRFSYTYGKIQCTNLAVVEKKDRKNLIFQVIDRNNGNPIAEAECKTTYYTNRRNHASTKRNKTDVNGEVRLSRDEHNYGRIRHEVTFEGEKGFFNSNNYYYRERYRDNKSIGARSFLFTDRSIYRPGQTVYFKGIVVKTQNDRTEVLPNTKLSVTLVDANEEDIKEVFLTTNEFGSVAGEFVLPSNGITGTFYLELYSEDDDIDFDSDLYFSVEEYKRPKFETTLLPITESYLVNDSIKVQGNAIAFAGSNITDAKVSYRVRRQVRYPRWYYYRSYYPESGGQEIAFGETTTDKKGAFDITFKALPDLSADKASLPIFSYEVSVDVTDVNGETQSTSTIVNVGYHTLLLNMAVAGQLDKNVKKHTIQITSENLNNQSIPAKGTLEIFKLKVPDHVLRPRPWEAPDFTQITQEEFKRLFPHDAYKDEDKAANWPRGNRVFSKSFDTEKDKEIALGNLKRWESGKYIVVAKTLDKFGQEIEEQAYTTLFSHKDPAPADNQLFTVTKDKKVYQVGDQAEITFGSASTLKVTVEIEKNHAIVATQIVHLDNSSETVTIPITEADLGGFVVHYSYAAFNSFKSGTQTISVPFPSKTLDVETKSFRDKLQPGTEETWSFKIKGPNGEKVSAELLASMYDASLDQFKPHEWSFDPIPNSDYSSYERRTSSSFGKAEVYLFRNYTGYGYDYKQQQYDRFNWFGFSILDHSWQYRNYLSNLRSKVKGTYSATVKEGTVIGTVYDENGLPIPYANVIVKGTSNGTTTDIDGNFSIVVEKGQILEISYLGYITNEITIKNKNSFTIYLYEDNATLNEVVVTGMGISKRKKALGYAVSTVESEELSEDVDLAFEQYNASGNIENLIQGKTAGVQITTDTINGLATKTLFDDVKIRKNLQETAFFLPQLRTDSDGNVSFHFTTPEALTRWKVQLLSHTKTLESNITQLETVTQKELMVLPNAPRFLREGDEIVISTKIANLTTKTMAGQAVLQLEDPVTGKAMDLALGNTSSAQDFSVSEKGNTQVSWKLTIPNGAQAVQYKIIAKASDYSDGEQNALPILSNRMLVTETLPMWVRSNQTKTFTLEKLKNNSSSTLSHHQLTLEMTSNPAWYAVQALPYLMEYPYECNEQTFARYYANSLASHIANSNPRIQEVFNQWKNSEALLSNLEKNQELKSLLIQETPWLRDAQSEAEQKKRIGLLFDLNKMDNELLSAVKKLEMGQMGSGAWPWFNGGYESRYITQHIATGFGHLQQLGIVTTHIETDRMITKAIAYLDKEFVDEYEDLKRYNKEIDYSADHLSYTQLHYLYMRSFFPDHKASKKVQTIMDYYLGQIDTYWNNRSLYAKGMMALVAHRNGKTATANKIVASLEENSITSEELGMYWKQNTASWYWYQAPIETQALMIEVFSEITQDTAIVDELKVWLLKNKQTNRWKTTKATTEAVYALLLQGNDWLSVTEMVDVTIGNTKIEPQLLDDVKVEAGTGYFKTSWKASDVKEEMATVTLAKKGNGVAWGGLYWQYFEDLDKITAAETPLQLKKKLFLKKDTDRGEELSEINTSTALQVGDLVRVRIELKVDREMDYVHMKDMRAAGLEPINVLSRYKYQDNLGYYEATKDASTNFFFERLPKGVFVFEYDLRVNIAGDFGNGITTIQCMYAPEFSSHSEGVRIKVGQ